MWLIVLRRTLLDGSSRTRIVLLVLLSSAMMSLVTYIRAVYVDLP